jgi:hypothetical protein
MACQYLERGGFLGDSVCGVTKKKIPNYTANNVCDTFGKYTDCEDYKKASGSCFITSSVCFAMGMDDDCDELMTIRSFRDNWMRNQDFGDADIADYYRYAPKICESINASGKAKNIYREIYQKYIFHCVQYIKNHDNSSCYELYKDMVNSLKARFLN